MIGGKAAALAAEPHRIFEELDQQFDLLRKDVDGIGLWSRLERARGTLIRTRRAAKTEIDATGIERFEQAENFGNLQRAVMGQHDARRDDIDMRGSACNGGNHDFRRGACKE